MGMATGVWNADAFGMGPFADSVAGSILLARPVSLVRIKSGGPGAGAAIGVGDTQPLIVHRESEMRDVPHLTGHKWHLRLSEPSNEVHPDRIVGCLAINELGPVVCAAFRSHPVWVAVRSWEVKRSDECWPPDDYATLYRAWQLGVVDAVGLFVPILWGPEAAP